MARRTRRESLRRRGFPVHLLRARHPRWDLLVSVPGDALGYREAARRFMDHPPVPLIPVKSQDEPDNGA